MPTSPHKAAGARRCIHLSLTTPNAPSSHGRVHSRSCSPSLPPASLLILPGHLDFSPFILPAPSHDASLYPHSHAAPLCATSHGQG